jgi:hypothetical protein
MKKLLLVVLMFVSGSLFAEDSYWRKRYIEYQREKAEGGSEYMKYLTEQYIDTIKEPVKVEERQPDELMYNPYQRKWSYERPDSELKYNPYENTWEYAE